MSKQKDNTNRILRMVEKMDPWEIRWLVGHIMAKELPAAESRAASPSATAVDPNQLSLLKETA